MNKANQYIQVVEKLSKTNSEINGDLIYEELLKLGVRENVIFKISGPLIRICEKKKDSLLKQIAAPRAEETDRAC